MILAHKEDQYTYVQKILTRLWRAPEISVI